jgi:hypothetical protein
VKNRVVKERLCDHQAGAQHRAAPVTGEQQPQQGQVAGTAHRPDLDRVAIIDWRRSTPERGLVFTVSRQLSY